MTLTLFLCIFGTLTQFRNNRSYDVSHSNGSPVGKSLITSSIAVYAKFQGEGE